MRIRSHRRASAVDRSPFNPVIVLCGPSDGGGSGSDTDRMASGSFEFYYDDGAGFGLRPLPSSMSEFLDTNLIRRLMECRKVWKRLDELADGVCSGARDESLRIFEDTPWGIHDAILALRSVR